MIPTIRGLKSPMSTSLASTLHHPVPSTTHCRSHRNPLALLYAERRTKTLCKCSLCVYTMYICCFRLDIQKISDYSNCVYSLKKNTIHMKVIVIIISYVLYTFFLYTMVALVKRDEGISELKHV